MGDAMNIWIEQVKFPILEAHIVDGLGVIASVPPRKGADARRLNLTTTQRKERAIVSFPWSRVTRAEGFDGLFKH